jgi:hypothetical protein
VGELCVWWTLIRADWLEISRPVSLRVDALLPGGSCGIGLRSFTDAAVGDVPDAPPRNGIVADQHLAAIPHLWTWPEDRFLSNQSIDGKSLQPLMTQPDSKLEHDALHWHYPHYHHDRPASRVCECD